MAWMKERVYGENASINNVHGPAYMLRNQSLYARGPEAAARAQRQGGLTLSSDG